MPLNLIVGPPNSGRAGIVLDALRERLADDPLLVVPTQDDAYRFERELCEDGAVMGISILTFDRLFDEVAQACGAKHPPVLSEAQRLEAVRAAIAKARPQLLGRSARRPGFVRALADVLDEAGAAGLDAATLVANAAGAEDGYLAEIADLCLAYEAVCDQLGRCDIHVAAAAARAALRAAPSAWGSRPVFFYGFDDMTVMQRELIAALAEAADVLATVTFENRTAMSARAELHQQLIELGGKVTHEAASGEFTRSATLRRLERSFLAEQPDVTKLDDGLALLEAAGERGQAEQIGAEIARLVRDGVDPARIAVVFRDIGPDGMLLASVLEDLGVPVAVDSRIPLAETSTGRCLIALLQGHFGSKSAADVMAFARTPGRMADGAADWLERDVLRDRLSTAAEVVQAAERRESSIFGWDTVREGQDSRELLRSLADLARRVPEYPLNRQASLAKGVRRLELRAGALASDMLSELAELPRVTDAPAAAIAALDDARVPLWVGPNEGRVRITTPYRVRAAFPSHLFVASLQEGRFPRHQRDEPLLSEDGRAALGMPIRVETVDEERYLFYICLSRPTERLYLSWRNADEDGIAMPRSPFVDDVRELLDPPPPEDPDDVDPIFAEYVRRRALSDVAVMPRADLAARFQAARARAAFLPGKLQVPAVREMFAERDLFSASQLEQFRECSFRWFVQHELDPEELVPDREAMDLGGLVHKVLESIYKDDKPDGVRPSTETLEAWRQRATELVGELAPSYRLAGDDPGSLAARARAELLLVGFLARDARDESALGPRPNLIEAHFGEDEEDENDPGPLPIADFKLRGRIDRIDVDVDGQLGVLRDYKTSKKVQTGSNLEAEGKLQLQLYARAVEKLWKIEPIGSVYEPLAAKESGRARGILRKDAKALFSGDRYSLRSQDMLDVDPFHQKLIAAEQLAMELVARIRDGAIRRDPLDDECPRYCAYASICRRERAKPEPEEDEDEAQE